MEYAERGSLADSLRRGRLRRADNGAPNLAIILQCLQDVANGVRTCHFMLGSYVAYTMLDSPIDLPSKHTLCLWKLSHPCVQA